MQQMSWLNSKCVEKCSKYTSKTCLTNNMYKKQNSWSSSTFFCVWQSDSQNPDWNQETHWSPQKKPVNNYLQRILMIINYFAVFFDMFLRWSNNTWKKNKNNKNSYKVFSFNERSHCCVAKKFGMCYIYGCGVYPLLEAYKWRLVGKSSIYS